MTSGGGEPPRPPANEGRDAPVLGWRARFETLQRRVLRQPLVASVMHLLRAYDQAGGGMLAGGLAYFAFFTMVPSLLLLVSLLGVLIEDVTIRAQIIDGLIDQLDPVRDIAREVIDGLAGSGRTGTIIGVLGLLWGASGFYGALQGAMQRLFPGPGGRDFLQTRLRGVLTVTLVLGSMLAAIILVFLVPLVTGWINASCRGLTAGAPDLTEQLCSLDPRGVTAVLGPVAAVILSFVAALTVYVAIPLNPPTLRQAVAPALLAGIAIGLLTSLFGLVANLLVGQWLALGIAGSTFVALIWFNLVFQALLFGAALARVRRDRARLAAGPLSL